MYNLLGKIGGKTTRKRNELRITNGDNVEYEVGG